MTRAVPPKDARPGRISPPQRTVLTLLRDGWELRRGSGEPGPFHKLVFYALHRGEETRWFTGTTLGSLERRGFITWEQATLTLAYDGSQVPGSTLRLTPTGTALIGERDGHMP